MLDQGISANTVNDLMSGNTLPSSLHIAFLLENVEMISLLLRYGADVNKPDSLHNTPLHLAAIFYDMRIMCLLLLHKADVSRVNLDGKRPIDYAAKSGEIRQITDATDEKLLIRKTTVQVDEIKRLPTAAARGTFQANNDTLSDLDATQLQLMKLSINSVPDHLLDNAMKKLLVDIEQLKIT
ncbi:ankyrin repeat domain-containing protein 54-like [Euwallacea similis]|uniref:ankyrin repeat domain-containing protein 54-like n=1 Tax=Euwallacea similis TaxID=1736056 RepID=UPI00344B6F4F